MSSFTGLITQFRNWINKWEVSIFQESAAELVTLCKKPEDEVTANESMKTAQTHFSDTENLNH